MSRQAHNYFSRGQLLELEFKPAEALLDYSKAYQYRSDNIEYGMNYADLLIKQGQLGEAEQIFTKLIPLSRKRVRDDSVTFEPFLAHTLNSYSILLRQAKRIGQAKEVLAEALSLYKHLATTDDSYNIDVASTFVNLGAIESDVQDFSKAEMYFSSAVSIRRRLVANHGATYKASLASVLGNLAALYTQMSRYDDATKSFDEAIAIWL